MSSFVGWGMTLLGLAVVTTIAEMLLPQGKTRKVIRSVMATVAVFVIVTPIPLLLKNGISFDFSEGAAEIDTEYVQYVDQIRCSVAADAAEQYLKQNGIEGVEVTVEMDGYTVKSATAKFVDSSITENGTHINNSEIKRLLSEFFGLEKEAVMAYG